MSKKIRSVKKKADSAQKTVEHAAKRAKKTTRKKVERAKKKINPLEEELKKEIDQYNTIYAGFSEHGMELFVRRQRSIDLLEHVEALVNSIAKTPKSFDAEISEVNVEKQKFREVCDFARDELESAKKSAVGAGVGAAGGATIAAVAPSAAMWVATTFGTASTGTAISTLSGAAATQAALAWLGGGTLVTGGGGVAAGEAFLLMTGPIGWGVAGATLLTSVILFSTKKRNQKKEQMKEIKSVMQNTMKLRRTDAKLRALLSKTAELHEKLSGQFHECMKYSECNFAELPDEEQMELGAIVNNSKALAVLLGEKLGEE